MEISSFYIGEIAAFRKASTDAADACADNTISGAALSGTIVNVSIKTGNFSCIFHSYSAHQE